MTKVIIRIDESCVVDAFSDTPDVQVVIVETDSNVNGGQAEVTTLDARPIVEYEPAPWFRNHYECCVSWTDEWSCTCNDRCPECRAETEPYESEELSLSAAEILK